jgi:hypothetical protein
MSPASIYLLLFSSKHPASPESSSALSTDTEPVEPRVPTLPDDTVEASYDTSQTLVDSTDMGLLWLDYGQDEETLQVDVIRPR